MNDNKLDSTHYLSEKGYAYFAYQNQGGLQQGAIEARKFSQYIKPSDTVIDFGCGSGAVLANLKCIRRVGIEINPTAREECERNGIEAYASLPLVPNELAQVAISNHALEHVPNPLETLRELRDKVVSSGKLYLCVPIDDWRTEKRVNINDINRHLYTWTPLLLGNLLDESGWEVDNIHILTHAWPPYWQKLDRHLPVTLFDSLCYAYSFYKKQRQLFAVASK